MKTRWITCDSSMRLPASGSHRIAATSLYTASDETHDIMGQNNNNNNNGYEKLSANKNLLKIRTSTITCRAGSI